MKKIFSVVMVLVAVTLLLHVALFTFINVKGKDILITAIKVNTGVDADIESLTLKFPFVLEIKGFKAKDFSFNEAVASLGIFNPFALRLVIDRVFIEGLSAKIKRDKAKISPVLISIKKKSPEEEGVSMEKAELPKKETSAAKPAEIKPAVALIPAKKSFSIKINNLYLADGNIQFVDLTGKKPLEISLTGANLKLRNFIYPQLTKFYLDSTSSIAIGAVEIKNTIGLKGWVDYFNKNMNVRLGVDKVDYFSLSDYCPGSWQSWSSLIEEAVFSFDSNLVSENNDLTIDCILSLDKISFKELPESEENQVAISRVRTMKTVIAFLKGKESEPQFRFKLKTKMDTPKLDFSSVKDNIKEIVQIGPITVIGETINRVKDKIKEKKDSGVNTTEEVIKGAVDIFKSIFKSSE